MLVIILDTKTALLSAREGVELCMRTVIPSLFPFLILSGMISSSLLGKQFRLLQPVHRLCKIPKGAESLLYLGFLAGYPVGAHLITQTYQQGKLSKKTALRMLGFCSNAGPAFLFGMLSSVFIKRSICWILWGVHIASSLLVGIFLPGETDDNCVIAQTKSITLPQALQNATKTMGTICGWVIAFRILIGFCQRWFLWLFPSSVQVLFSGFLELSNGCVMISSIPQQGMRFIFASAMLSFGGLCVGMQTQSVTEGLGSGYYFPGKVLHCLLATTLSCLLQPLLFGRTDIFVIPVWVPVLLLVMTGLVLCLLYRKKVVAFAGRMLYNTRNHTSKGAAVCYFEEK